MLLLYIHCVFCFLSFVQKIVITIKVVFTVYMTLFEKCIFVNKNEDREHIIEINKPLLFVIAFRDTVVTMSFFL